MAVGAKQTEPSSGVAHTVFLDDQQPELEDDTYCTVDDKQHKIPAVSGNLAYEFVPELNKQPMQEDDQVYSNIDQQEAVKYSENPKQGTALTAAASAK